MLKQESLRILKEKMELLERLTEKEAQQMADALLSKYGNTFETCQKDEDWKPNHSKTVTREMLIDDKYVKKNSFAA